MDSQVAAEQPSWLKQHGTTLVIIAAVTGLILWKLYFLDVVIAAAGLSFIIFIHELGHFLAAKACNVHVKTFSIGFGPALPFCSYQFGETTYKLALIPLGGFVSMVGQEDGVIDEKEDTDPRSYRNKSVPQRMLIISAGVIMNVILAAVCFIAAYLHGVQEKPAVIAHVEPGSAMWRAGIPSGAHITRVGSWQNPVFDDIRPLTMSAAKSEMIPVTYEYKGKKTEMEVSPLKEEDKPFPVFGILFPSKLELPSDRRIVLTPYALGSAAALAKSANDGPGFLPGDKIVAMTDPSDPNRAVKPIVPSKDDPPYEYFEYHRRLVKLAGEPITFVVVRKDAKESQGPVSVTVAPSYRKELGMRMRMGPIVAVRKDSPAEKAGVIEKTASTSGDRIVKVEVSDKDGKTIRYTNQDRSPKPEAVDTRPLDPMRLAFELRKWANTKPSDSTVRISVLREKDHTEQPFDLPPMKWDESFADLISLPASANSPEPINELGLAFQVLAVVDAVTPGGPAEAAGVKANDEITAVMLSGLKPDGSIVTGKWQEIKPNHWPSADQIYQHTSPAMENPEINTIGFKVKRGTETVELKVVGKADRSWPLVDRGIDLVNATEFQQAQSIGEALEMGFKRTQRTIRGTYLNLYGMITGRTSITMISGPITLARVSYLFAGQDTWLLIVLLGVISVNLAVVNFLPIPLLDGGHMVFLGYELIRGKPAPERVQEYLTYGLACAGSLMLLSIGMDIWRLFN
ncbi:MAG: site-2 protease family protein [Gemmataceae bacterium]